jgi:hypothetical protein
MNRNIKITVKSHCKQHSASLAAKIIEIVTRKSYVSNVTNVVVENFSKNSIEVFDNHIQEDSKMNTDIQN